MERSQEKIVRLYPALAAYARKRYRGTNDRRAKSFREAWDFAAAYGGVLQTARDAAARRIMAAKLGLMDDPSLLPQHTRTLALYYMSEEHWFIAFDDDPTQENLAWVKSHAYASPAQYSAGWAHPLDARVYAALERAIKAGRILPHPSYDHATTGTWLKSPLGGGQDRFEELALSGALFGELAAPFARAHIALGREALHYHLPRMDDLDEQVTSSNVLTVPVVLGGAHAVSPVIYLEKCLTLRQGIDTYLAASPL